MHTHVLISFLGPTPHCCSAAVVPLLPCPLLFHFILLPHPHGPNAPPSWPLPLATCTRRTSSTAISLWAPSLSNMLDWSRLGQVCESILEYAEVSWDIQEHGEMLLCIAMQKYTGIYWNILTRPLVCCSISRCHSPICEDQE